MAIDEKKQTAKEMFEEFAKMEGLYDVLIEERYCLIPYFKITFSESGCCDHRSYIEVTADDRVSFDRFRCDVENLELLTKAIHQQMKELGWI